jgi:hypothetical protein
MKNSSIWLRFLVFSLTFIGTAVGQDKATDLRFKNVEHLIGTWKGDEEIRLSPEEPWEKGKSEWEVRWLPGGYGQRDYPP